MEAMEDSKAVSDMGHDDSDVSMGNCGISKGKKLSPALYPMISIRKISFAQAISRLIGLMLLSLFKNSSSVFLRRTLLLSLY